MQLNFCFHHVPRISNPKNRLLSANNDGISVEAGCQAKRCPNLFVKNCCRVNDMLDLSIKTECQVKNNIINKRAGLFTSVPPNVLQKQHKQLGAHTQTRNDNQSQNYSHRAIQCQSATNKPSTQSKSNRKYQYIQHRPQINKMSKDIQIHGLTCN